MEKEFTIVLPDPQILSQVCGTNDSNLRLIERHLGVSIFTRGNELSISDTSAEIRQEFKFIIDRLTDELSENGSDYGADGQELVESVLNTGFEKTESENFNALDFSISIPGSTRKIYPKTKNQARLVEAFRKSTMVFATGPAGCGKTFLAVAVNGLRTLAENCNSRQKFFQFRKIRFYFFHCGSSVKAFYGSLKFSTDIFVGFSNFAYKIFRKGTFYTAVNGSLKRIGNPGNRRNYYAYSVSLCPVHDDLNRI